MKLKSILNNLQSGQGEIRPIIDYYAKTNKEWELFPYLTDPDISSLVVYILNELPRVDPRIIEILHQLVGAGKITKKDRFWVDEILNNHSQ